ncbi:MAG: SDR family NAD(P)-dependent oxidoreductase, partial [Phycisphaeraceae bacterium]|nr:SDR family NAD(P)-dependent oxidoreductase [Phycisphaeraceae bacterium]
MPRDLRGQVLIITGASAGIGAATAVAAARAGMRVVLAARRGDRLEQVAKLCRQAAGHTGDKDPVLIVPTDVRSDEQVQRLVNAALERFGRIDA